MKRERAYVEGRRNQIIELLTQTPQLRVDDLAKASAYVYLQSGKSRL